MDVYMICVGISYILNIVVKNRELLIGFLDRDSGFEGIAGVEGFGRVL
jgi:hypothetical protein